MSAPTLTQVPVHGTFTALDGSPAVGYVSFTPVPAYRLVDMENRVVVVPQTFAVPIDANGEMSTSVPATDDTSFGSGTHFSYQVFVALADRTYWFWMQVPAGTVGTIELADHSAFPGAAPGTVAPGGGPTIGSQPPVTNLALYAGDDFSFTVTVINADDSPADLSGAQVNAQIRDPYDRLQASFTPTIQGNVITLSLAGTDSATLAPTGKWDCQLTDGTGTHTLAHGAVTVSPDVSRPTPPSSPVGGQPTHLDLQVYAGDDFPLALTVNDSGGGPPPDLSGAQVEAQIRDDAGTLLGAFTVTEVAGNVIWLMLPGSVSATLPPTALWDCQMADPQVTTLVAGTITVTPQVTQ